MSSKKQDLVLPKESTPTRNVGTTELTRPQFKFNSEKSIQIEMSLTLREKTRGGNCLMSDDGWEGRGVVTIF